MKKIAKVLLSLLILNFGIFTILIAQNNCLDYDGIDDYVDCGNNSSLNITDAITIEAWMKPSADNWKYKKPITLNPVTPEADYQIRVRLTTSNFNYSNAQTDGDDVRFFDSNGNSLNYWIEVWDNTGTSTIWVKVTTSGTDTIYMYYGNPTATSESNGTNTFEFFDDFESYAEGSDINGQGGWTTKRIGGSGYAKVETKNGKKHLCLSSTHDGTVVVHAYSSSGSLCLGSRAYRESAAAEAYSPGFGDGSVVTGWLAGLMMNGYMTIWYGWDGLSSAIGKTVSGVYTQLATISGTSSQGMHYLFDFVWDGSNLRSYRDGTLILSGTDNTFTSQTHVHLSSWGTSIWDTDWIFIRKYASSEPFATIGNETAAGISKAGSYGIGANTTTAFAGINDQALSGTISSGWNHIAFTYNKNAGGTDEMKLYINGVQKATGDYSIAISTNTNNFFIGDLIGFVGLIDEVRIWKVARTEAEIRANMYREIPNPTSEANLVAYYQFNETSGTNLPDKSSNSNNGTLTNMDPATDWVTSTAPIPYYTAQNGNWNTNTSWASGQNAPTNDWANAEIKHDVTITSDEEANDLTINTGKSLTINADKSLTVNGILTNGAGTSGLVIKSDASSTGSLIHNTAGVNATVERYLTKMQWHFIGIPIASEVAGVFHLPGHSNIYLKTHNENDNTWGNFIYEVTTPLILGRGYECWVGNATFSQDETIEFEGALNAGDYTTGSGNFYDLEYTPDHGLNLISNPYPSALEANINTTAWAKTNIVNSVWTWDGTAGNYVYWNGIDTTGAGSGVGSLDGGIIPSMQAFFVLANGSNPSLTIPQSSRVHSSQAYYKGTSGIPNTIRLDVEGNGYKDAMFVSFNELATDEYEGEYDVKKIYGLDQAPQLYSIIPGEILSINSLSELNEYRIVNLGFECGVPAIFTIEASEIESFKENITIYLEDIKEGTMFNLSENPSYTFNYEIGDDTNRFLLHFGEPNSIDEPGQQNKRIYSNENIIYIQQPAGLQGEIVIYNILGQEIKREKVNNEELTRIRVTNGTGYYIVKVKTGKQLLTQKVFIR